MCVCVFVCEGEKERDWRESSVCVSVRERERDCWSQQRFSIMHKKYIHYTQMLCIAVVIHSH